MDGGMKMKKFGFLAAVAAITVLFGCSRSEMPGDSVGNDNSSKRMLVRATLGEGVKSHFAYDGYKLIWDNTDQLEVRSLFLGRYDDVMARAEELMTQYAGEIDGKTAGIVALFEAIEAGLDKQVTDKFTITPNGSGKQSAVFQSSLPFQSMFGKPDSADDELFAFTSLYPARETVDPIKMYYIPDLPAGAEFISTIPYPYMDITVPDEQDGVHYGDYQLLMGDAHLQTRQALSATDDMLDFSDFTPLTSILEFTIATTDNVSAEIDHMTITLSTQNVAGGPYESDRYIIAGKAPLFFTFDEPEELRIWNRNSLPLKGSMHSNIQIAPKTGWAETNGGKSTITLNFASPVQVSQTPTAKKYYAVMIPSRCYTDPSCGNPILTFDAYNAEGDKILTKAITTSYSEGIMEGRKYSFDLTLDTYYPDDVLSGLFSVAEGKLVYIASGNLQAYLTPGGTATDWRIAPTQYEYVGASSYDLDTYEGWFDLFCFSAENNNFGISTSLVDNDHLGEARGWTDAYPVAQGRGWRTITDAEGVYLFGARSNASDLFSFATVVVGPGNTEVNGLIFLPDSWTLPETCTFKGIFEGQIYDYSKNVYYAENAPAGDGVHNKWEDMQAAGAVFWPAAGMRQGTDVDLTLGAYWSGTPNDTRPAEANMLYFCDTIDGVRSGSFSPSHYPRSNGACVRLIKEFN